MAAVTPTGACPPPLVRSVESALRHAGESGEYSLRCEGGRVVLDLPDAPAARAELTTGRLDEGWVAAALVRIVRIERLATTAADVARPTDVAAGPAKPTPAAAPEATPPAGASEATPPTAAPSSPPMGTNTRHGSKSPWELRLRARSMTAGPWMPGLEAVRHGGDWDLGCSFAAAWLGGPAGVLRGQELAATIGRPLGLARWTGGGLSLVPRVELGAVRLSSQPAETTSGAPATLRPCAAAGLELVVGGRPEGAWPVIAGVGGAWRAGPTMTVDGSDALSWQGPSASVWVGVGVDR